MSAVDVLSEAIRLIGEVVSQVKDKRQASGIGAAADALTVIGAIVESVEGGNTDKITPEQAMEELDRLRRALGETDAAVDQALADKFGGEDQ